MTKAGWLSLDLVEDALPVFEAGGLGTVEPAGSVIVGIPKSADGHYLLGTASLCEEATVIATILQLLNLN